ncbi:MAG: D-2-hydroxyacid dehydrogenase [Zestosphaera sp.]
MKALLTAPIHKEAVRMLEDSGFQILYREYPSESELVKLVEDVDVLFVRSKPLVTAEVINSAKKLKIIARAGVGLDNIDVRTAEARGIKVINTPEAPTRSVAELVFGLTLALARRISYSDRKMREGKWVKKEAEGFELKGKTLGVVGLGRIGREVALIATKGFGMRVIYYDPYRLDPQAEQELGVTYTDLDTLLRESDVVTLHVPLTPQTRYLIGEGRLRLMKRSAVLINTSRGGVIDTQALIKALNEGWIAGAGLDVYEEEPLPPNHPLTAFKNVVLAPHAASATYDARHGMAEVGAENLLAFYEGRTPPTLVNREVVEVRPPGFAC